MIRIGPPRRPAQTPSVQPARGTKQSALDLHRYASGAGFRTPPSQNRSVDKGLDHHIRFSPTGGVAQLVRAVES